MFNILVVDDDKNTRIFMRAVLEAEGIAVIDYKVDLKKCGKLNAVTQIIYLSLL